MTWEGTEDRDLHQAKDYKGIKTCLAELYPDEKPKTRDADDLIDELLGVYDKLDADLRALVPLKRVWTLAAPEET